MTWCDYCLEDGFPSSEIVEQRPGALYHMLCKQCDSKYFLETAAKGITELNTRDHFYGEKAAEYHSWILTENNIILKKKLEADSARLHAKDEEPSQQYAFTLTAPPDLQLSDVQFRTAAAQIFKSGLTAKNEKVTYGAYCVEYHENGAPHLHGVYTTGTPRRILQKYFKRYWKIWDEGKGQGAGFKGGYHQKARDSQSYEAYIEKGDGLGNQGKVITYDTRQTPLEIVVGDSPKG